MTIDVSAVKNGYDRWTAVYDHDANPLYRPWKGRPFDLSRWCAVQGLQALDLGWRDGPRHA